MSATYRADCELLATASYRLARLSQESQERDRLARETALAEIERLRREEAESLARAYARANEYLRRLAL